MVVAEIPELRPAEQEQMEETKMWRNRSSEIWGARLCCNLVEGSTVLVAAVAPPASALPQLRSSPPCTRLSHTSASPHVPSLLLMLLDCWS